MSENKVMNEEELEKVSGGSDYVPYYNLGDLKYGDSMMIVNDYFELGKAVYMGQYETKYYPSHCSTFLKVKITEIKSWYLRGLVLNENFSFNDNVNVGDVGWVIKDKLYCCKKSMF